MSDSSPHYHASIQHGYGTVIGDYSNITQHFHFSTGIATLSTDYAHRIQNFLTEYLGTPKQPVPFGGRNADLTRLDAWLDDPKAPPYALLTAPAGRGKSALLVQWSQQLLKRRDLAVVFFPISIRFRTNLATVVFASLTARLATLHEEPVPTNPHTSIEVWRDLVLQYLSRPLPDGKRLILVIDALDEAAWEIGPDLFPSVPLPGIRILVSTRLLAGDADARVWLRRLGWERQGQAYAQEVLALSQKGLVEVLRSMGAPLDQLENRHSIVPELFRLTEGDPLLIRLYVEALWEQKESVLQLRLEDLSQLAPGLEGYFARWWEEQQKLSGKRTLPKKQVEEVLNLLACALGPMTKEDLLQLSTPKLKLTSWTLEEALRPLHRLVLGDGRVQGYVFSHPRLAGYFFSDRLTEQERRAVEDRFLQWGAHTIAGLNAEEIASGQVSPYLLQYYGAHLERNRADAQRLMTLVNQGWMRAWERYEGAYAGFLQDVTRAKRAAKQENDRAISAEQQPPFLDAEVFCALCQASVNSLATNIPPALLVSLVRERYWTSTQGLASARQIADPQQRAEVLRELIPLFPETLKFGIVQEAFEAIPTIIDEFERAKMLNKLLPHLPGELLMQALEIAQAMKDDFALMEALWELALFLPKGQNQVVLERALQVTLAFKDKEYGESVLTNRVSILPEHLLEPVLTCILEAIQSFSQVGYKERRAFLFKTLALRLSEHLVEQILRAVLAVQDEWLQAEMLIDLVPYLSEPLVEQATEALQIIRDEADRCWVLCALVPRLPACALEQALKCALTIRDKEERERALATFASKLPEKLLEQAFGAIQSIQNEQERALVLRGLVPRLPESLLEQTLILIQGIKGEQERAITLREFSPIWPEGLLAKMLEIAQSIKNEKRRVMVLREFVRWIPNESGRASLIALLGDTQSVEEAQIPHDLLITFASRLPDRLFEQALAAIPAITHDSEKAKVIRALAPRLPEGLLEQMLRAVQSIRTEWIRVKVLSELVPDLPDERLKQMLEIALTFKKESDRFEVLSELVPRLPDELLEQVLGIVQAIEQDGWRHSMLKRLAPWLPESLQARALAKALAIENDIKRIEALSEFVPICPKNLLEPTIRAAQSIKGYDRDYLRILNELAPRLPLELLEKTLDSVQTINDEEERDYALARTAPHMPVHMLEEALAIIRSLSPYHRKMGLETLALYLPETMLEQALCIVQEREEIDDGLYDGVLGKLLSLLSRLPEIMLEALCIVQEREEINDGLYDGVLGKLLSLLSRLSETMLEQALCIVQEREEIDDGLYDGVLGKLLSLLSRLPEHSLEGTLIIDQRVLDDRLRDVVLILLAQVMPGTMMKQALSALRAIKDIETRDWALMVLVPQLQKKHSEPRPDDLVAGLQPDLLEQALEIVQSIDRFPMYSDEYLWYGSSEEKWPRISKMEDLSPELTKFSRQALYPFWNKLLFLLSQRTRSDFLSNLGALAPVLSALGGPGAVAKVVVAIQTVSRWWP
jgi:hypothetical protein